MRIPTKKALENFRALEPAQQERVQKALMKALEMKAQASANIICASGVNV